MTEVEVVGGVVSDTDGALSLELESVGVFGVVEIACCSTVETIFLEYGVDVASKRRECVFWSIVGGNNHPFGRIRVLFFVGNFEVGFFLFLEIPKGDKSFERSDLVLSVKDLLDNLRRHSKTTSSLNE